MLQLYMRGRSTLVLLLLLAWSVSATALAGPSAALAPENFPETFESGTKGGYAAGPAELASGTWTLDDALLGSTDADKKEGTKSVRIRNAGRLTMDFFLPEGAGTVTVRHAVYGNDAGSGWELWSMTDACDCEKWTKVGATVISSSTSLQTAAFRVNTAAPVRFEIRKVSGGSARLNIDDFSVGDYDSTVPTYPDNDHLALGNPSMAVADVNTPNNYLMRKPQYALSYSRDRGTPNWVSWHLDASDRGSAPRQDDFREDPTLPEGWYRVNEDSYRGSGFDRGHNTPSADRTSTVENNSATFLMTNMIPQAPQNNQQTWNNFEQYTRSLIASGYEVYLIMGNYGVGGTGSGGGTTSTIDGGRVTVPNRVWKVAVILPVGDNDVSRISAETRIIAIDTPNSNSINANWGAYRVSVDEIEAATGLDLLSALPESVQATVEASVDNGPTN
ncbi:DNA/RNA non-specific endonuclease [Pontibacter harenae]|uniref:DNA/RNA non-specific endonuclease n=1 Tax=Pontibacter harenae TaxID=2894083 RepID=UPI001E4F4A9F|nr:DNA/RNA non-specific endonuclease [Pontibacter harenae]MCC9167881.1 DNA/RNA non-specific endonuclease [Pontibacter harenae]